MEAHSGDRLGPLLDQLDRARELAKTRLEGLASPASLPVGTPPGTRRGCGRLGDEEYLWEPAPGAWSIRRRGQASTPRAFGPPGGDQAVGRHLRVGDPVDRPAGDGDVPGCWSTWAPSSEASATWSMFPPLRGGRLPR